MPTVWDPSTYKPMNITSVLCANLCREEEYRAPRLSTQPAPVRRPLLATPPVKRGKRGGKRVKRALLPTPALPPQPLLAAPVAPPSRGRSWRRRQVRAARAAAATLHARNNEAAPDGLQPAPRRVHCVPQRLDHPDDFRCDALDHSTGRLSSTTIDGGVVYAPAYAGSPAESTATESTASTESEWPLPDTVPRPVLSSLYYSVAVSTDPRRRAAPLPTPMFWRSESEGSDGGLESVHRYPLVARTTVCPIPGHGLAVEELQDFYETFRWEWNFGALEPHPARCMYDPVGTSDK